MDAYSACAMWEVANIFWAQLVILHHLANFFGWHLTVPERHIKKLKSGALHPISDSVVVDRETVAYWCRKIKIIFRKKENATVSRISVIIMLAILIAQKIHLFLFKNLHSW